MLLYNNDFLPLQDLRLPITNRAFQYNDGFFETILVVDGKLRFWQDHLARIREAAMALQLAIPDYFWDGELEEKLLQLAKQRNATVLGRLKLKVWRAGAGLYTPQTDGIEWLATAEPAISIPDLPLKIGVCQTVKTCTTPLSHFKGPHAPLYVLAGMEKQASSFDDMLLLNAQGYVAELISSNIFWMRDGVLYTPALTTGCVNGILRRNILRWCQQQGIVLKEVMKAPRDFLHAEVVFAANVTGIRGIHFLVDQELRVDLGFLTPLKRDLQV